MRNNYEAAVIFGGVLQSDGSLPLLIKQRVDRGIELYRAGEIGVLIMSGFCFVGIKKVNIFEAEAMQEYAISQGVKKKDIILEKESRDTIGNIYFSEKIIKRNNWKRIVFITSCFHKKRVEYLLKKILNNKYEIKLIISEDCKVASDMYKREENLVRVTKKLFCIIPSGCKLFFGVLLAIEYSIIPLLSGFRIDILTKS